jgi:threonine/homoserine/homoserine lactone efflux protein
LTDLLPGPAQAASFALAVLVLNATPGADLLLTLGRSLAAGVPAGLATALGINAGCVVHALGAAFGLAAVLAVVPGAFLVLQWAGAAYLVWLGLGLWREGWRQPGPPASRGVDVVPAPAAATSPRLFAEFRRGLLTNVLNPKVALFFLAFLPPFVPVSSPSRTASFLLLGAWFVLQSTVFLFGVVLLAARLRRWQTPQSVRRLAGALGGMLFMVLAWRLAGAQAAPA